MKYITSEQWQEFNGKFPEARQWLISASIKSELEHLENIKDTNYFNDWQKNRLAELRECKKFCDEINRVVS